MDIRIPLSSSRAPLDAVGPSETASGLAGDAGGPWA